MDYLKTRAPFWKQVEAPTALWVDAEAADDAAAERWIAGAAAARSREVVQIPDDLLICPSGREIPDARSPIKP